MYYGALDSDSDSDSDSDRDGCGHRMFASASSEESDERKLRKKAMDCNGACDSTCGTGNCSGSTGDGSRRHAVVTSDPPKDKKILIGNASLWREVEKCVVERVPVFVCGPSGVGKSHGTGIMRDRHFDKGLRPHDFAEAASHHFLHTYMRCKGGQAGHGILVDDPEILSEKKQKALINLLQKCFQSSGDYKCPMPIVVTGDSEWSPFMRMARKHFGAIIKLKPVPESLVRSLVSKKIGTSVRYHATGDVRQSLIAADFASRCDRGKHSDFTSKPVPNIFETARRVLNGDGTIAMDAESFGIVQECYIEQMKDIESAALAADAISFVDASCHVSSSNYYDVQLMQSVIPPTMNSVNKARGWTSLRKSTTFGMSIAAKSARERRMRDVYSAFTSINDKQCTSRPRADTAIPNLKLMLKKSSDSRRAFDRAVSLTGDAAMANDLHGITTAFTGKGSNVSIYAR